MTHTRALIVRMPPELREKVAERAASADTSMNQWINHVLTKAVLDHNDILTVVTRREYTL